MGDPLELLWVILAAWIPAAASVFVVFKVERYTLSKGIPSLGIVFMLMYVFTYLLGWTLWRFDPSSLFGYGTASSIGSLNRMGYLCAIGLPSLATGYSATRYLCRPSISSRHLESFPSIAARLKPLLLRLSISLVLLTVSVLIGMSLLGLHQRDALLQQQALNSSWLPKLLIGTGTLSRLAPIGLLLVPLIWSDLKRSSRFLYISAFFAWGLLATASGSRGQILALPLYLLLGALVWRRISLRRTLVILLIGTLLFLPLAEMVRVRRANIPMNSQLSRKFETFQIGKQLLGTSHEFYLFLRQEDCAFDLERQLQADPPSRRLLGLPSAMLRPVSSERWNVVRLYEACSQRKLKQRTFSGFDRLPLGLIPNTIVPAAPSLFDGQILVESISDQLGLRPGEISQGTLSIFADAWWRWRWPGVAGVCASLGILLGLIQSFLLWLMVRCPTAGLLGQLLVLSLVGSWINNTSLTMIWFLLWDMPKVLLELMIVTALLRFRLLSDFA